MLRMKFSNEKAHRVIRLTHHTQGEPIRLRLLTHLLLISHRDIIKMYPSQKIPKNLVALCQLIISPGYCRFVTNSLAAAVIIKPVQRSSQDSYSLIICEHSTVCLYSIMVEWFIIVILDGLSSESLLPEVSSSCHLRKLFLVAVASGLTIRDRNLHCKNMTSKQVKMSWI